MSKNLFYIPPEKIQGEKIIIDGEEFRHAVKVLRLKKGDVFDSVDGKGFQYRVTLKSVSKTSATGEVVSKEAVDRELPVAVTLAVGIVKGERMDWLVEKAVELGVKRIIPLVTEFSVIKTAKTDRWKKIMISAMKQSMRTVLPTMDPVTSLSELVKRSGEYDLRILAYEKENGRTLYEEIKDQKSKIKNLLLFVGPEGGFSDEETNLALQQGFTSVSLGKQRLRTETAAISCLSLLSQVFIAEPHLK